MSLTILSVSSTASTGSSSSAYSRSPDDLHDRLVAQESSTTFSIWSAGNLRLHDRDLTIPPGDASELLSSLKRDARFEVVSVTYLDGDKEEWKASILRVVSSPDTPTALSDSE
ncbi:hypothetical protein BD324DRAFT_650103 [Kockovaella imperatae]|uniref:Uncharacterized protein n=1 Tax=Kockovaella imperatae TaxID=4999 RepID=A0A1Y1UJ65_9TREE|nr:hypothetical protein BD324DRAFT_650103 [Kockovaella imperatae]ORX37526.1 hypothetical protein BD324DRAFT_650103 [Kockovaella imperatae]